MKKKLLAVSLALVMILSLVACNAQSGSTGSASAGGDTGASGSGGSDAATGGVVDVGLMMVPSGLEPHHEDNPYSTSVTFSIFDRLVAFDNDTNEWLPQIASSWEQVDEVTWTFEIRDDVTFHNGDPLTMDDVVFSFERQADFPRSVDTWEAVESVSYEGNTLTMKFKDGNVSAPSRVLAIGYIVNKAYVEEGGDDAMFLNPVGTGPYKVTEFTPLVSCTIEAFADCKTGEPKVEKMNFTAIADNDARYIALESGQLDFAGHLDYTQMNMVEEDPNLTPFVTDGPTSSMTITCIAFQCTRAPFDNANVRRALAYACDVESICAALEENPAKSLLFGGYEDLYYESSNFPEFDLEKAQQLLEAEGYNKSNPLKVELLCVQPSLGQELYQSDLQSIGVEMTLSRPEFGTYVARETGSDFDMIWTGQGNRGNHPLTDMDKFSDDMYGSRNFTLYTTPQVQDLINTLRMPTEDAEFDELSKELNDILAEDVPMMGIFLNKQRSAMVNGLTGVTVDGYTRINFRDIAYTG